MIREIFPICATDSATVTAADLVRHFSHCRDRANKEPLFVSSHGRPTHVMLSLDQYNELAAVGAAQSSDDSRATFPTRSAMEMAECLDTAVIVLDQDLQVLFANRIAHEMSKAKHGQMVGKSILTTVPQAEGSPLEAYIRRTAASGEHCAADLPSVVRPNGWIHMRTRSVDGQIVATLRDITDDVNHHRMADVKEALLSAISTHEDNLFYVRLSVRGTIDRADPSFCKRIGLVEERLLGIAFVDLVARNCRVGMRDALESSLRGTNPSLLETVIMCNSGALLAVTLSLVPLHGTYGCEGAVMLMRASDCSAD